jgi:hypothetical protein
VSHNTALTAAQKTIQSNCINWHFLKLKRERDTVETNQETSAIVTPNGIHAMNHSQTSQMNKLNTVKNNNQPTSSTK